LVENDTGAKCPIFVGLLGNPSQHHCPRSDMRAAATGQ